MKSLKNSTRTVVKAVNYNCEEVAYSSCKEKVDERKIITILKHKGIKNLELRLFKTYRTSVTWEMVCSCHYRLLLPLMRFGKSHVASLLYCGCW